MATHEVGLLIPRAVPVGNVDVEITVKADGKPLGRVALSKGSIDWIPSPKNKSGYWLTWEEFADLMVEHGGER